MNFLSQALETIRPYKPVLIGSASYGNVFNDIDMLICVDAAKLEEVESKLSELGFTRQSPTQKRLTHACTARGSWRNWTSSWQPQPTTIARSQHTGKCCENDSTKD